MNNLESQIHFYVMTIESFLWEVKVNSHVICKVCKEFNSSSKSCFVNPVPSSRSDILQRSFKVLKPFHKLNWHPEPLEVHPSLELVLHASECHANVFPISWGLICSVWLRTSQKKQLSCSLCLKWPLVSHWTCLLLHSDSWFQSRGSALLLFLSSHKVN